jgi:multidrug efflux pump subunit AcrA (membrane-fusion protein)
MYVDVAVELPIVDKVLTIPATSVLYAPFGDTVYVVDSTTDEDGRQGAGRPPADRAPRRAAGDFVA